jgi:hypothetical protein
MICDVMIHAKSHQMILHVVLISNVAKLLSTKFNWKARISVSSAKVIWQWEDLKSHSENSIVDLDMA